MIPTISQVCSLNSSFEDDIQEYAAGGCDSIEVWLTKLEGYLKNHSLDDVHQLVRRHDVRLAAASYQGGLFEPQPDARHESWSLLKRRLELCAELHIPTLVVAGDMVEPFSGEFVEKCVATLSELATTALAHNVRIAFEFQAQATFPNNLASAVSLIEQVGHPHIGICLDLFHFFVGPSKWCDVELLGDRLFHVQVCDLAGVPREVAQDSHRILPGDGDMRLATLLQKVKETGFSGCVSLELMNPMIWSSSARQIAEVGIQSIERSLGE